MSEAFNINKKSKSVESMASRIKASATPQIENKKQEQWVMRLNAKHSEILYEYCCYKAVSHPFEESSDALKLKLVDACFDMYLKRWWSDRIRPSNPLVQALNDDGLIDSQVLFVLNDKFNINITNPQQESEFTVEWAQKAAILSLVNAGLSKAKAQKFVEMEIECTITTHFLTLSEMMDGRIGPGRKKIPSSATTQEAGRKLLLFLAWNGKTKDIEAFSEDEIAAITYNRLSWVPRPSMLERIFNYAKTIEEMKCILSVFSPVLTIRSEEYGISDTTEKRKKRLIEAAKAKLND